MIFNNLSARCQLIIKDGLELIKEDYLKQNYFNAIKGLTELMKMFEEDEEFYGMIAELRDVAKDAWREKMNNEKMFVSKI